MRWGVAGGVGKGRVAGGRREVGAARDGCVSGVRVAGVWA